jgi:uncharacterized damage-inducible protein DinB
MWASIRNVSRHCDRHLKIKREKGRFMNTDRKTIEKTIGNALSGKGAHVATRDLFAGLNWKLAGTRPEGAPHSVFQLLNHMAYWQDWAVKWLDGENPAIPRHASLSWPSNPSPADAKEWQRAVRGFQSGLDKLARQSRQADLLAKRGKHSRVGILQAIASHNSYHGGQVVVLRQVLGAWPPPSGGVTW